MALNWPAAILRGVVRLRLIWVGPTFTLRVAPSVKKTTLAGTCSDKPNRFAAYTPDGCSRMPSLRSSAFATVSIAGQSKPKTGWTTGTSYRPRPRSRIAPTALLRVSAVATAVRLPRSAKSVGVNTQPGPCDWIRCITLALIESACLLILQQIILYFRCKNTLARVSPQSYFSAPSSC